MKRHLFYLGIASLTMACQNPNTESKQVQDGHEHHQHAQTPSSTRQYIDSLNNGLIAKDTLKGSPERIAMTNVGQNHVHLTYHSPGVKERVIWGGLVPYGQVWVTGAHTATNVSFTHDAEFNGTIVPAGKYAIFTIPGEEKWIFILNKNYDQHLADDYDEKEDVVRLEITPTVHSYTARLTYFVHEDDANNGKITMAWDKLKIEVPFTVK